MRALVLPLAVLVLAVAARRARAAEEVFVLDNGSVFRGHVLRQDEGRVEVRLAGFGRDSVLSIETRRIVSRFVPVRAAGPGEGLSTGIEDWSASARPTGDTAEPPTAEPLPAVEPGPKEEGFFQRLARVTSLSLPEDAGGRVVLAILVFVALLALVALGGRVAEVESMGLASATLLALLLGGFLAADIAFHAVFLRADRAAWVLPAQGVAWLAVAASLLRCEVPRVVLLFSFVLFGVAVGAFSAGAILVAY